MANRRNEARRRQILEGAAELIGRDGIGAVTHRAVAGQAGVPLAATTYYFASKDVLLGEALELYGQVDVDELETLAIALRTGPMSVAVFAEAIAAYLANQMNNRRYAVLAQYELDLEAARRPALRPAARSSADGYVSVLRQMLVRMGSTCPDLDARLLMVALNGLVLDQLATGERVDRPGLARHVARLVEALTRRDGPAAPDGATAPDGAMTSDGATAPDGAMTPDGTTEE